MWPLQWPKHWWCPFHSICLSVEYHRFFNWVLCCCTMQIGPNRMFLWIFWTNVCLWMAKTQCPRSLFKPYGHMLWLCAWNVGPGSLHHSRSYWFNLQCEFKAILLSCCKPLCEWYDLNLLKSNRSIFKINLNKTLDLKSKWSHGSWCEFNYIARKPVKPVDTLFCPDKNLLSFVGIWSL